MQKEVWIVRGLLGSFLLYNTYWDIRERKVLIWTVFVFGIFGFFYRICNPDALVLSGVCGMLPGIFLLIFAYATREKIGYGDGLAVVICGIYLGFGHTMAILFYALLLCSVVSIFLIWKKKRNASAGTAFLPYLFAAYLLFF